MVQKDRTVRLGTWPGASGTWVRLLGTGALAVELEFEVPGGSVQADGIVRSVAPDKGMGVEFTRLSLSDRILLERLLKRLLP